MAKDWMSKLSKLPGAVNDRPDPHACVIQTPSPSLNFIYGNGWGLPMGFSAIIYGPPKAGKTVVSYSMAGQMMADYPDKWVIRYDTEYRDHGQLTPQMQKAYGIDMNRYKCYETNHPKNIYVSVGNQIRAMCADGLPIGLMIIDSMNGVQGRRALDNEKGMMAQQMGDVAATNKEGLKVVLEVQREFGFSLLMTSHVGVEMDPIEQKRGNKFRMGASIGVQHHAEYFIFVDPNRNKDGKADLTEGSLIDTSHGDMTNRGGDLIAHKIRVQMKDSSMGPKGRRGQFTFNYRDGIINQHEEVYVLGLNRGIITKPSNAIYEISGYEQPAIKGEANFINWLKDDKKAQEYVLKELRRQDLEGVAPRFDKLDEAELIRAKQLADEEDPEGAAEAEAAMLDK